MTSKATIKAYDQYAGVYDQEVIDFWKNFPREFIDKFVENLPGKRVLNVGSGSGRDALLLGDYGLDVMCQDGSKSMVRMTTELGFESLLSDFDEIDFPLASFDGIWAYTSLIHIPKTEAGEIIRKLRGLLKPNGIFAIGVIEGDSEGLVERKSMPGVKRYFKNYMRPELRETVEQQGFKFFFEHDYQPHHNIYMNQIYIAQ